MATNGELNGTAPIIEAEAPISNGAAPVQAPISNGNGHVDAAPEETPLISRVRGPLGIGSASLQGKVALVTGSGE